MVETPAIKKSIDNLLSELVWENNQAKMTTKFWGIWINPDSKPFLENRQLDVTKIKDKYFVTRKSTP